MLIYVNRCISVFYNGWCAGQPFCFPFMTWLLRTIFPNVVIFPKAEIVLPPDAGIFRVTLKDEALGRRPIWGKLCVTLCVTLECDFWNTILLYHYQVSVQLCLELLFEQVDVRLDWLLPTLIMRLITLKWYVKYFSPRGLFHIYSWCLTFI